MEWISVKEIDNLKRGDECIVYNYTEDRVEEDLFDGEDWVNNSIKDVTHWMPQPTAPMMTSEEWSKEDDSGIKILDPDGWDRKNWQFSWHEEHITQREYENRRSFSTCRHPPKYFEQFKKD